MTEATRSRLSFWTTAAAAIAAVAAGHLLAQCGDGGTGSVGTGTVECVSQADCEGGELCVDDRCARLCNQSSECPTGEMCRVGVCAPADVIGCSTPSDCTTSMLLYPDCYDVSCRDQECTYELRPADTCAEASCANGVGYAPRLCGERGLCDSASADAVSCGGFTCDASETGCRTECTAGGCADGYSCQGTACVTDLGELGDACSLSAACVPTATCIALVCRANASQSCGINTDCVSGICVDGVCSAEAGVLGGNCDDTDDCESGLVCADGACRYTSGNDCAVDFECEARNCECDDSACGARTCVDTNCVCGYGTSGACDWSMDGGIADPEDCDQLNLGCVGGSCTTP